MHFIKPDAREELVKRIFPALRYGGDPDIERYFDLRREGKIQDALSIYHRKLKIRYPDDKKRIALLVLFRSHDPRFPEFLKQLLLELADTMIIKIRKNIDVLIEPMAGVPVRNTYRVLKAVESVTKCLPPDSDEALSLLDDYVAYSELLAHRPEDLKRIQFFVGEFFAQSSGGEEENHDFIERSRIAEERRREASRKNYFDLSKIEFAPEDIERIQIPEELSRKEDRVLSFCYKYWLNVTDPAFERIVFLYSRKHGTHHYDIFRVVKIARTRKYTDDEMLNMVSTVLSSRYSYSVQGDIYMQTMWKRLKSLLTNYEQPTHSSPDTVVRKKTARRRKSVFRKKPAAAHRIARNVKNIVPLKKKDSPTLAKQAATPEFRLVKKANVARIKLKAPAKPAAIRDLTTQSSISDRIKKLSGRTYDVYRDIFMAKVRDSIRDQLVASRMKASILFSDDATKAEDIVFEFMDKNYSNSYMDWKGSDACLMIAKLGYQLDSLDMLIESCYKKL